MSAQSQLKGIFPSSTGPSLNGRQIRIAIPPTNDHGYIKDQKDLGKGALPDRQQIFPVHLWVEGNPMHFLFYNPYLCSPLKAIFLKNQNSPRFSEWFSNFEKNWGPRLRKALGIADVNYFSLKNYMNLFKVMDHFVSDFTEGKPLKKLTDAGIDLDKFNITAYEFHYNDILYNYNGVGGDQTFSRISMSILLPEVINWMQNRIDADISGNEDNSNYKLPKLAMFSTHDVTLGSVLSIIQPLFNIKTYYYTPFASSFFFELSRNSKERGNRLKAEDYSIKIIFNDHDMGTIKFPEFKRKILGALWSRDQIFQFCGFGPKATA
jgi:hypothetical protein